MNRADKKFLFLQGHPSGFWHRLATELETEGIPTRKVNFCLADWAFWRRRGAINYRGRFRNWPTWLEIFIQNEKITDILYYADRFPYHAAAADVARKLGVNCWAVEFGYLRPDWLTMEADGMGPKSRFPKQKNKIETLARKAGKADMVLRYPHSFLEEAVGEVLFNLLLVFGRPFYPFFFSDKYYWPVIDYLAWLPELARSRKQAFIAKQVSQKCLDDQFQYNLVAMQLQSDYQIRSSTKYNHLEEFLLEILTSFAKHAPAERYLVFKIHPLDNGLENWPRRIASLTSEFGLKHRVHVIKGGPLDKLISNSKGVVLANSTVGLHAIRLGVPIITLGNAVFNIPDLSHQAGLDKFWNEAEPANPTFASDFFRALTTIQIKGSFYNRTGQNAAIKQIVGKFSS